MCVCVCVCVCVFVSVCAQRSEEAKVTHVLRMLKEEMEGRAAYTRQLEQALQVRRLTCVCMCVCVCVCVRACVCCVRVRGQ